MVWQSDTSPSDAEFGSIWARVYDASGNPVGSDFQVNTSTSGDQIDPAIAMADNGTFVIVWHDDADRPGTSQPRGREVRARVFNANGAPVTGEIQLNTVTGGTQRSPEVAMRPDGQFVAVWTDLARDHAFARRFAANGAPLDAEEFQVSVLNDAANPSVAVDPLGGSFMVVWESRNSNGNDSSFESVQARGFAWSGAGLSAQVQVNQSTNSNQFEPRVAAAGGEQFFVIWRSQAVNPERVDGRGISVTGTFQGSEQNVRVGSLSGIGGNGDGRSYVSMHVGSQIWVRGYDHPCEGAGPGDPPPPYANWLSSPDLPGFEIQVRITGGGGPVQGAAEGNCIIETICASGALAGRPEVFFKVIGPRPNGFLWVQLIRFSPSQVEVWARPIGGGQVNYYLLQAVAPGSGVLDGLEDRMAFFP
ncbi:MAG TPA: hypothetical protein VMT16_14615 [Thermoanaerobaculia bacterium]|nr:hypothetical protein [Thermoanaerobaculia bacterium]